MNILSKFQLSSSSGLGLTVLWIYFLKPSLNYWTAPATPGLLITSWGRIYLFWGMIFGTLLRHQCWKKTFLFILHFFGIKILWKKRVNTKQIEIKTKLHKLWILLSFIIFLIFYRFYMIFTWYWFSIYMVYFAYRVCRWKFSMLFLIFMFKKKMQKILQHGRKI